MTTRPWQGGERPKLRHRNDRQAAPRTGILVTKGSSRGNSRRPDVSSFAEALEEFGMLELSAIAAQATRRMKFLDYLQELIDNEATLEKDIHKAFEKNLWVLGRQYALMSSNVTLKKVIENYSDKKFMGERASKRPDLLLSQDLADSYLLIEFKRPNHSISRNDIAQAEIYRDELSGKITSRSPMRILMIGKGSAVSMDKRYETDRDCPDFCAVAW